jgi:hypothetical protein
VRVWEIWNEPDLSSFWSGAVEDYVALLAAAYRGAKRADPECLVVSADPDGAARHLRAGRAPAGHRGTLSPYRRGTLWG